MRLFALETNIDHVKKKFLSTEEREIMTVFFHGFRFFLTFTANILWTFFLVGVLIGLGYARIPPLWLTFSGSVIWFFFIFIPIVKAYLDWRFDFILVTSDKVIVVDQSSFFHQKITPMNLENFASVSAETQYWNLFPFGTLHFNLKEGAGEGVELAYIPSAHEVASKISDAITIFQRRKDLRRYGGHDEV